MGILLLVVGVGSLVLLLLGYQPKLVAAFGETPLATSVVISLIGAFLLAWSFRDD
jgi:hypothetical protein